MFASCWCTKFHPDCAEKGQSAEGNRALKQRLVADGIAHAALVYDGERAVAWAEYGSPEELPEHPAPQGVPRHCRATARLPGHVHPGRARPSRSGPGGDRPARSRRADRAGRWRLGRGVSARHRRGPEEELVVPLQRHPHDVRARGLYLRPAQGPGQLRDGARGGPEHARLKRSSGSTRTCTLRVAIPLRAARRRPGWRARRRSAPENPRRPPRPPPPPPPPPSPWNRVALAGGVRRDWGRCRRSPRSIAT